MTDLVVDFCSYQAAKFAVEHWHYSERMPKSKLVKIGVWESGKFIGVVIFGVGATSDLVKSYGLECYEGCELVRVALNNHVVEVTKIISLSIKILKQYNQGLRLIVSFADIEHGHNGIIYQAGNWYYTGRTLASDEYIVNGKRWHGRAFRASKPSHLSTKEALKLADVNYTVVKGSSKFRYIYPLDKAMRRQVKHLAQPYPKKENMRAIDGNNLVSNQTRRFDSVPSAIDTPERSG